MNPFFIQSTPALSETSFSNSLVIIIRKDHDGAVGFIINKPLGATLNQLEEFRSGIAFPLYQGGPSDAENMFFLHRRPDLIEGGEEIDGNIYLGGDFQKTVELINTGALTEIDLKLFVGYCGWDEGELEQELEEGSWEITEEQTVFASKE